MVSMKDLAMIAVVIFATLLTLFIVVHEFHISSHHKIKAPDIRPIMFENKTIITHKENEKSVFLTPKELPGLLRCRGKIVESEVIYWKRVLGDDTYISPIIPKLDESKRGEKFLSFEYDHGGWNNVRSQLDFNIEQLHFC